MKDVIVYRCGKVVADGVELSHVRAVDPPFSDAFGSVTFDITGTLTYSPLPYAKAPVAAVPVPVPVPPGWGAQPAPVVTRQAIDSMYQRGKINYGSYRELCAVMGVPPPPPPPPEPEHPDTTRVRKVTARIEDLWHAGALTTARRLELLNALG